MNKKLVKEFLIITFVIMLIFWGESQCQENGGYLPMKN